MPKPPISKKLFSTVFFVNVALILMVMTLVVTFTKRLEEDFLRQDFIEERDFFLSEHPLDQPLFHRSKNIFIEYIPALYSDHHARSALFDNLSAGQHIVLDSLGRRFLINIEDLSQGRFYHARNVSQTYEREVRFLKIVAGIALLTILFSFFLAYSSSRRIVAPLKALAAEIQQAQVSKNLSAKIDDFEHRELDEIAQVFNQFLVEMSQYVERERALVGMASHELKTPVSVILGALEVFESQQTVLPSGQAVLDRISAAAHEMSDNIDVLLKLSRRDGGLTPEQTHLGRIASQVLNDLSEQFEIDSRVRLEVEDDRSWVNADPALVKMLIRNTPPARLN
jgi:signal transduction histidine kinase